MGNFFHLASRMNHDQGDPTRSNSRRSVRSRGSRKEGLNGEGSGRDGGAGGRTATSDRRPSSGQQQTGRRRDDDDDDQKYGQKGDVGTSGPRGHLRNSGDAQTSSPTSSLKHHTLADSDDDDDDDSRRDMFRPQPVSSESTLAAKDSEKEQAHRARGKEGGKRRKVV